MIGVFNNQATDLRSMTETDINADSNPDDETFAHSDFRIGTEFYTEAGLWRCTDIGTRTTVGMLSPSTEATSVVSAESDGRQMSKRTEENVSRRERDPDFEARRSRAASAPTRFPLFPHRGSRESSKQDVRTTVFGHENLNGDLFSKGGTVPRRRSRMRLAFWKKRSDSGIE